MCRWSKHPARRHKKMRQEAAKKKESPERGILLDPERKSARASEFEDKLSSWIVGQERAVRRMSGLFQIYLAGMNNPARPIGTMLFLGPTGSGKTRVVEAASEVLFNEPQTVDMISGGIGFAPTKTDRAKEDNEIDTKIYRTALEAAKRKFSPEFMNRIDKVVVFRSLKEHHLRLILDIELRSVQDRITESAGTKFVFECTDAAKEFLLGEGIDLKYGARHLKRAIERFLVYALSNLVATEQVETGDLVMVDYDSEKEVLTFSKQ